MYKRKSSKPYFIRFYYSAGLIIDKIFFFISLANFKFKNPTLVSVISLRLADPNFQIVSALNKKNQVNNFHLTF